MVSVDGLLDANEIAVRARVEDLRERLAEAERDLEHALITRQRLRFVLAGQDYVATERVAGAAADQASGPARTARPVAAGPAAVWGAGMTETALAESYRAVWLAVSQSGDGLRAGELCALWAWDRRRPRWRGMRSKLKQLAGRGCLVESAPGCSASRLPPSAQSLGHDQCHRPAHHRLVGNSQLR